MDDIITVDGTAYNADTPFMVIKTLENARKNRTRIRLYYGDINTGKDWGEVHDVTGYVGRTTGPKHSPILVHNTRSMGGGLILTKNVVRVVTSAGSHVLYSHPNFH